MQSINNPFPNIYKKEAQISLYSMIFSLPIIIANYIYIEESIFYFIAGFMLVYGALHRFISLNNAKKVDALINGKGKIATWTYENKYWLAYLHKNKKSNNSGLVTLSIWSILAAVATFAFWFAYNAGAEKETLSYISAFPIIFIGISIFTYILIIIDPYANTQKGRILFGVNALYIEGEYIEWQSKNHKIETSNILDNVIYDENQQNLIVSILIPNKRRDFIKNIILPLPANEEKSIAIILDAYKGFIKNKT